MIIYKTPKNYYYKINNNNKIRISKNEFNLLNQNALAG